MKQERHGGLLDCLFCLEGLLFLLLGLSVPNERSSPYALNGCLWCDVETECLDFLRVEALAAVGRSFPEVRDVEQNHGALVVLDRVDFPGSCRSEHDVAGVVQHP